MLQLNAQMLYDQQSLVLATAQWPVLGFLSQNWSMNFDFNGCISIRFENVSFIGSKDDLKSFAFLKIKAQWPVFGNWGKPQKC